jgi:hypothetical protein
MNPRLSTADALRLSVALPTAGSLLNDALQAPGNTGSSGHAVRMAKAQIGGLIEKYRNPNSILEEYALKAAALGKAAYWKHTSYENQVAIAFAYAANEVGIAAALDAYAERDHPMKTRTALISYLIPLNTKAVDEIGGAKATAYWADA